MTTIGRSITSYFNEKHDINYLALCHGKKCGKSFMRKFNNIFESIFKFCTLNEYNEWYYVDLREEIEPDLIADVLDHEDMRVIPDNSFDIIGIIYCPLPDNFLIETVRNVYRILKPNGKIYIAGGIGIIMTMMLREDEPLTEYNEIINNIKHFENDPNIEDRHIRVFDLVNYIFEEDLMIETDEPEFKRTTNIDLLKTNKRFMNLVQKLILDYAQQSMISTNTTKKYLSDYFLKLMTERFSQYGINNIQFDTDKDCYAITKN